MTKQELKDYRYTCKCIKQLDALVDEMTEVET